MRAVGLDERDNRTTSAAEGRWPGLKMSDSREFDGASQGSVGVAFNCLPILTN